MRKTLRHQDGPEANADPAPPLGSWRAMYWLVLGTAAVLIVVFWLLTRAYQ